MINNPNSWRAKKAAELNLSEREREMIEAFEMIATGSAVGFSDTVTLSVVRDIALETLEKIGWPTVVPRTKDAGNSGCATTEGDCGEVCDREDADVDCCEDREQCGGDDAR